MVADMSTQVGLGVAADSDTVSVCSIGVYGTKYERSGEPVPNSIELAIGYT